MPTDPLSWGDFIRVHGLATALIIAEACAIVWLVFAREGDRRRVEENDKANIANLVDLNTKGIEQVSSMTREMALASARIAEIEDSVKKLWETVVELKARIRGGSHG